MDELYPLQSNTDSISAINACIGLACLVGLLVFIQHFFVNEPNRAARLYRRTNYPINI